MGNKSTTLGHIACFVSYAIFGVNIIVCKDLSSSHLISPIALFCLRSLGAGLLFWLLSLFMPYEKVEKKDFLPIFAASILGFFLTQITFLIAISDITPMDCAIVSALSPIYTMIIAAIAIKEPITLKKATREDIETIWKMQVEAFTELLDKYQDFDMSPATESLEKIIAKFEQPWTTYYYIVENDIVVGAVRIVNKNDGSRKRISPIWIMGEFRNKGYAQQAMIELENIYGSDHWCLDTILQEKGNLHLYEKMGYVQTGKVEHINEKMDIVFYEKN